MQLLMFNREIQTCHSQLIKSASFSSAFTFQSIETIEDMFDQVEPTLSSCGVVYSSQGVEDVFRTSDALAFCAIAKLAHARLS